MEGNILVQRSVIEPWTISLRIEAFFSRHLLFEVYNPSSVSTRVSFQAVSYMFKAMVP